MDKYRVYPEYKDSRVGWLGAVPDHWRLEKAKFLLDRKQRPVRETDGVVTAFRDGEVTLRSNRREAGFTNSLKEIGYQGVRVGDLLIHAMDGFAGAIGVSDSDGKCSPVCSVCVPTGRYGVLTSYYGRLLRHMALTGFVTALAKGIRERSTEFRFNEFKELTLPLPPEDEQSQIATFLDRETAKIDRLIAKQETLIALLKEKRQAVISHAVTKGLDPDTSMKDSGVEWLGEIPAHWEVKRLKHLAKLQSGIAKGKNLAGKEIITVPYLRVANVQDGYVDLFDVASIEIEPQDLPRYLLRKGDVLMNEGGDNDKLGRGTIWNGEIHPCIHQNHVFAIRPHAVEPEWVSLLTQASYLKFHFYSCSKQSTNLASISGTNTMEAPLVIPPSKERDDIRRHIEAATAKLNQVIQCAEKKNLLLQERRTALISAAVTGKIDVREEGA